MSDRTAAQEVLFDSFGRIHEAIPGVLDGCDLDTLHARPDPEANSIAWLLWHLIRIQDDHLAGLAGVEQVWTADGWHERWGLPFEPEAHGYGHSSDDVAKVRVDDPSLITGYHEAVHALTERYLSTCDDAELARVVDTNWDPPVTVAVRLVSVLGDGLQHLGQADYAKGLLHRAD
jgi:hypothetical protein